MKTAILFLVVAAALAPEALGQIEFVVSPAENRELQEGERFCGNYFVVRKEDKEQKLIFRLSTEPVKTRIVYWLMFPMRSVVITVVEGTETAPVARLTLGKKGARELEVLLSPAQYEAAQGCLPAPRTNPRTKTKK